MSAVKQSVNEENILPMQLTNPIIIMTQTSEILLALNYIFLIFITSEFLILDSNKEKKKIN